MRKDNQKRTKLHVQPVKQQVQLVFTNPECSIEVDIHLS